ncbi:MAG: hypothetical protein HON70_06360 [Lentisphaerae bacterium]|nr:hypothetical protein [Lentisphaerota bacterium]
MAKRHINLTDLTEAIRARVETLCPTIAETAVCQATSHKAIVERAVNQTLLPAGIVLLGPIATDDRIGAPGQRVRNPNLGVLLISEYDADFDGGAVELFALIDEVDAAFMPSADRGDDDRLPVAVLGDQNGADRGVMLIPAGWVPLNVGDGRSAGVYNLLAVDDVRERS